LGLREEQRGEEHVIHEIAQKIVTMDWIFAERGEVRREAEKGGQMYESWFGSIINSNWRDEMRGQREGGREN
jgi:hypothetical protein